MISILQCPVCRGPLLSSPGGCRCPRNHPFDAARQGYVNFLLAHKKHSKEPGDSRDMITSRRRFLDRGRYDALSDGINETAAPLLSGPGREGAVRVLDAGCGEGFYLQRLKDFLARGGGEHVPVEYYGVDISRFAVRQATQRDRTMHWFVAGITDLPFLPESFDLVLSIFSPAGIAEFSRVLKSTGSLVIAGPGPGHLKGLREIIYPVAREHGESSAAEKAKDLFSLSALSRITYQLELGSSREIMDLLAMTPYFWNIDRSTWARVEALGSLPLDVDVEIRVFRKKEASIAAAPP